MIPVTAIDTGACRHKLVHHTSDRGHALQTAAALAELIEPPADAVAIFEVPGDDTGAPPEGWRIDAYYIEPPDADTIADAVADLLGTARPWLVLESVPDENWVTLSQAALPPVIAGRFTVHGSHDRGLVPRGPWSILIDAAEAFGTAHHATTLGCLVAVDRLAGKRAYRRVLDLGCGTGVLAIAARRTMPHARIVASDIDPIAVRVAAANARTNGVTTIKSIVADGVPRGSATGIATYDLVIANILARPLVRLAPAISRSITPGGTLVLSGLLNPQAREVQCAYLARGFSLARHDRIAGWSILTLIKRKRR